MQMASRNSAFKQCKNHSLLGVREKPPVLLVDIYFIKINNIPILSPLINPVISDKTKILTKPF